MQQNEKCFNYKLALLNPKKVQNTHTHGSLIECASGSRRDLQWPLTHNLAKCGHGALRWERPLKRGDKGERAGHLLDFSEMLRTGKGKQRFPDVHSQCTTYCSTWHHYRRCCPGRDWCGRGLRGSGAGPACNPSWSSSSPPAAGSTPPETHTDTTRVCVTQHVKLYLIHSGDFYSVLPSFLKKKKHVPWHQTQRWWNFLYTIRQEEMCCFCVEF